MFCVVSPVLTASCKQEINTYSNTKCSMLCMKIRAHFRFTLYRDKCVGYEESRLDQQGGKIDVLLQPSRKCKKSNKLLFIIIAIGLSSLPLIHIKYADITFSVVVIIVLMLFGTVIFLWKKKRPGAHRKKLSVSRTPLNP